MPHWEVAFIENPPPGALTSPLAFPPPPPPVLGADGRDRVSARAQIPWSAIMAAVTPCQRGVIRVGNDEMECDGDDDDSQEEKEEENRPLAPPAPPPPAIQKKTVRARVVPVLVAPLSK